MAWTPPPHSGANPGDETELGDGDVVNRVYQRAMNKLAQPDRTEFVTLRFTEPELQLVSEVAAHLGLKRATFIRDAILDVTAEILDRLRREEGDDEPEG